jgi:hypothetical protein
MAALEVVVVAVLILLNGYLVSLRLYLLVAANLNVGQGAETQALVRL